MLACCRTRCCHLQVLQYYYRGVASWDWFYPYHYAPMAQDMRRLDGIDGEQQALLKSPRS
jgi:5'-3' exonuclease